MAVAMGEADAGAPHSPQNFFDPVNADPHSAQKFATDYPSLAVEPST